MSILAKSALSDCGCGEGGVCPVNWALPKTCYCDLVSKGIFVNSRKKCNTLVNHCENEPCVNVKSPCINGIGTFYCPCDSDWTGHVCNKKSKTSGSLFIWIWYPTEGYTHWDLLVTGAKVSNELTLILTFDYGRTWELNILKSCEWQKTDERVTPNRPMLAGVFNNLSTSSEKNFGDRQHYLCRIPLAFVPERTVKFSFEYGSVGQYHNIGIQIRENSVVHLSEVFRVFINSISLLKKYHATLEYSSCGLNPALANYYDVSSKLLLSVTVTLDTAVEHLIRKYYEWYTSPFYRRSDLTLLGEERNIELIPSLYGIKPGLNVMYVNITFHDIVSFFKTDAILGVCFVQFIESYLIVYIRYGNRFIMCEVYSEIILESVIVQSSFPKNELSYRWECPTALCGKAKIDQEIIKFSAKVSCHTTHEVVLTVKHAISGKMSTHKTNLTFVPQPYNIILSCNPVCLNGNPAIPVTIIATEDPSYGNQFYWSSEDDTVFDNTCKHSYPSNIAILKPNVLPFGSSNKFEVKTKSGSSTFYIEMANGPSDIRCDITPNSGVAFIDKFNLSCTATSNFPPLTYAIYEGENQELISASTSPLTNNLQINYSPVSVEVTDVFGLSSNLTISPLLYLPSIDEIRKLLFDIPSRIDLLQPLLRDKAFYKIAEVVDSISKLTIFPFPFDWKHRLMSHLAEIRVCNWIDCIIKAANAVRRLSSGQPVNNTQGVDDFILKASTTLYTLIQSLDVVATEKLESTAYGLTHTLSSIFDAVTTLMELRDPILSHPYLDEDIRRIHFRKIQEGNKYARTTLSRLGLFVVRHLPHPTSQFAFTSGNSPLTLTIISHKLEYINCILNIINKRSYFQFELDKMNSVRRPGIDFAVAIVNYNKKNFWWHRTRRATVGEMFEAHVYEKRGRKQNWTLRKEMIGPVRTFIKFTRRRRTGAISGIAKDPVEDKADVHRIPLLRGYSSLSFAGHSDQKNITKIFTDLSHRPVFGKKENAIRIRRLFYVHDRSRDVYVGVVSEDKHVAYNINYSVVRCVTWSENLWKSEFCYHYRLKREFMVCRCRRLSLLNVQTTAPKSVHVPPANIHLYTSVVHHYFVLLILTVVMTILGYMLFMAWYLDFRSGREILAVFLDDNYPGDSYPYLVAVCVGGKCFPCTSFTIALRLFGESKISKVHILAMTSGFNFAHDFWYILFTPQRLGKINAIQLWQHFTERSPEWYCDKVIVWDLRTLAMFKFPVQSWLTVSRLHSQYDTSFLVKCRWERERSANWWKVFLDHMEIFTRQEHHWASLFILHPRSRYTHVDRTAILSVLILVTMSITMYFYKSNSGIADESALRYTKNDLKVSLIAITVPGMITFAIKICFTIGKDGIEKANLSESIFRRVQRYVLQPAPYLPIMTAETYQQMKRGPIGWTHAGYAAIFAIILSCIFYILIVGFSLNKNKSLMWLISSTVAIVGEAFVLNPLNIILISIYVSSSVRLSGHDVVVVRVDPLEKIYPNQNFSRRLDAALVNRVRPGYKPPRWSDIAANTGENADVFTMGDGLIILIFTCIVVIVLNINITLINFSNYRLIERYKGGTSSYETYLYSVLNRSRYFNYLMRVVIPTLHRITWYNGRALPTERNEPNLTFIVERPSRQYRGFCIDYSTKLVGVPQLRQQRVATNELRRIASVFKHNFHTAYGYLHDYTGDTNTYLTKWRRPKGGEVRYKTYRHWTAQETNAGWLLGSSRLMYSGSGYVEHLHWSSGESLSSLVDLEFDRWLDNKTRSVFLTFNLYNMYVDITSSVTFITECLPSGVYGSRIETISVHGSIDSSPNERIIFVSVLIISGILIIYITRSLMFLSRYGSTKWTLSFSRLVNVSVVSVGICFVVLCIVRSAVVFGALDKLGSSARNEYTSLHYIIVWDNASFVSLGIFSMALSVHVVVLVHRGSLVKGFKRTLASTWLLVISFALLTIFTSYFVFSLYFLGTVVPDQFFFVYFLKDASSVRITGQPTIYLEIFLLGLPFFFVLLHLNNAISFLFYFNNVERSGRHRLAVAQLRSRTHRHKNSFSRSGTVTLQLSSVMVRRSASGISRDTLRNSVPPPS